MTCMTVPIQNRIGHIIAEIFDHEYRVAIESSVPKNARRSFRSLQFAPGVFDRFITRLQRR